MSESHGFKYTRVDGTPEYFVEGFSEILIGMPVSKVVFHTVVGVSDDGEEDRESAVRLVIPTVALMEFCRKTLFGGLNTQSQLKSALEELEVTYNKLLSGVEIPPME